MIVVLIGPPGAGKTEQGRLLNTREHAVWLSMGEMFRRINDAAINEIMQKGGMVDDAFVNTLVQGALAALPTDKVVVLDGFPRHAGQADWLVAYAKQTNRTIQHVIHLKISEDESIRRLSKRGRADDDEQIVRSRYQDYMNTFNDVISQFVTAGVSLSEVNGEQPVEDVFKEIDEIVYDVHQNQNR